MQSQGGAGGHVELPQLRGSMSGTGMVTDRQLQLTAKESNHIRMFNHTQRRQDKRLFKDEERFL